MADNRKPSDIYHAGSGEPATERVADLLGEADHGHARHQWLRGAYRRPADVPPGANLLRDDDGQVWQRIGDSDMFMTDGQERRRTLVEIFDDALGVEVIDQ